MVVGGGVLTEALYKEARQLNWPLLPSYGMTETASQIATASLESLKNSDFPKIFLLDHAQVEINESSEICVQTTALCSAVAHIAQDGNVVLQKNLDKANYQTGDLGTWSPEEGLIIYGRRSNIQKVSGELVSLSSLEKYLESVDGTFLFASSERLGYQVILVLNKLEYKNRHRLIKCLEENLAPYEMPKQIYFVEEIPRTDLGKVKQQELLNTCSPTI